MNHKKLKCYCLLLEVARSMPTLMKALPRGTAYIEDQLKRALSSAILNLAEGNGRKTIKERNRFFDISLASIAESSAAIDVIDAYGYISAAMKAETITHLRRSYGMIMNLKS